MGKAIQLARIGVALDANTINYINDLKKAQIETDKRLDLIDARFKKSGKGAADTSDGVSGAFKLQKNAASQLGFQLQDVAVQAQMGTDAFIILAQQGSQLAGVLGPGGALIGAALAIGGALVGSLVAGLKASEKEAKSLIPTLEEMTTNIDELGVATARLLQISLADQMKKEQKQIDTLNARIQSQSREYGYLAASGRATKKQIEANNKVLAEQRASLEGLEKSMNGYNVLMMKADSIIDGYNTSNKNAVATNEKSKKLMKEQQEAVVDLIAGYQDQLLALQLTDKQYAIHNALVTGATPSQIKQIELLYDTVAAYEAEEEALKKSNAAKKSAQKFADSLIKKGMSEQEELAAKEAQLRRDKDLISESDYQAALLSIRNQYTALELDADEQSRIRMLANAAAEKKAAEEVERKKRQLATDTYDFLSSQSMTSFERIELESARELELLNQKYADQQEAYIGNKEALKLIDEQYAQKKADLEKKVSDMKLKTALGDVDVMGEAFDQQLKLQETYTKAKLALDEASAISGTLSDPTLSFWEKAAAVVSMTAKFAALAGQFHGGTDSVPQSMNNKSFMLKAGERVVQPEANKKLTNFLDNPSSNGETKVTYAPVFNGPVSNEAWFKQELSRNADQVGAIVQKQQRQYPNRGRK